MDPYAKAKVSSKLAAGAIFVVDVCFCGWFVCCLLMMGLVWGWGGFGHPG
jgi:hypothetical protein